MKLAVPDEVNEALERLRSRGYEANPVGGCVRDSLLGLHPEDWDICTSARPEETEACFSDCRVLPTGFRHGTVTVLWGERSLEITTYRKDGSYSDHRRPGEVFFVSDLQEDLARRDFTVNAMALSPQGEVLDPFGGVEDLKSGLLRCVGDPDTRFREDALRILRLLRFASRLGFRPEKMTLAAALRCRDLLPALAGERVLREICLYLEGPGAGACFPWAQPILEPVLPELLDLEGEKEAIRLDRLPPSSALRLGLLLRSPSGEKADALRRMKSAKNLENRVRTLAAGAWNPPPGDDAALGLALGRTGEAAFRDLLLLWRALQAAPEDRLAALERELEFRLRTGFCFSAGDLEVTGSDLLALGYSGVSLGNALRSLLEEVQAGALPNEKAALLEAAEKKKTAGS